MSTTHITINDLKFSRQQNLIFDNLDMQFERGKITVVLGPSGIGKTTLLKLIGGQIPADQGEVLFNDVSIHACSEKVLYETRKKRKALDAANEGDYVLGFSSIVATTTHKKHLSEEFKAKGKGGEDLHLLYAFKVSKVWPFEYYQQWRAGATST